METKEPLNIDEVHAGTLKIVEKLSSICDMLHIDYFPRKEYAILNRRKGLLWKSVYCSCSR